MSDATLWINDADSTATIAGTNVSYTMPLWVFESMRDIIVAEAEKKVEVTHRDFDIQQELLDRYRAENAKLQASNEVIAEDHAALCEQNAALLELVRDYHRFADALCSKRDCDGCSQRDEGACERGVLTSRECVLGVET